MNSLELIEQTIGNLFDQLKNASNHDVNESDDFISPATKRIDTDIATYTHILRSVQRRLSACQTRRNVLAPINQLSQDIIHLIFDLTVKEWKAYPTYYANLFSLRFVCKAWDSFVRDHSSFWAVAFPAMQDELHDITIPRSHNHPLEIRYPGSGRGRGRGRGGISDTRRSRRDRFLSRVIAERWPIKTLDIQDFMELPAESPISALLTSPAPLLETVSLDVCRPFDNLFGGAAPVLRHATFKRLVLGQHVQAMPTLRSLELHQVRGLDLRRLLQILVSSPDLEQLGIRCLEDVPGMHPVGSTVVPFTLHRLRTLKLRTISSTIAIAIINAISMPETTRISAQTIWHHDGPPNVDPDFSNLILTLIRKYSTNKIHIAYRLGQTFILKAKRWKICSFPARYNWTTDPTDATTHSTYLFHMIPTSARMLITDFKYVGHARMDPFLRALNAVLPSLRSLSFEMQRFGELFAVDALTETIGTGPGHHRWLLPELRRLTVEQSTLDLPSATAVVTAAEERSQNNAAGITPSPLESFTWKVGGVVEASPPAVALVERMRRLVTEVIVEEREPSGYRWPTTGGWDSDVDASDDGLD